MERLNQFFDHVKERLSNPFIYSFIVSWLVINWSVVVGVISFESPANGLRHLSMIEFIKLNTSEIKYSVGWPLFFALVYTFLSPIGSNLISAFKAWNSKWGESLNLRILKGGKVSIEKYMEFKKRYEERSKILEEVISKESATVTQLENTKTALQDARNQLNQTTKELSDKRAVVDNYNNTSYIEGKWIRTTESAFNNFIKQNIEFRAGIVYEYDGQKQIEKYVIRNYSYNSMTRRLTFTLFHFGGDSKNAGTFYSFNDLEYSHKEFVGTEYQNGQSISIKYERSPEVPKQESSGSINGNSSPIDESDAILLNKK